MNKPVNLNKLGIWAPKDDASLQHEGRFAVVKEMLQRYRAFLLIVAMPTLLAALYFGLIASDQYESQADFVIRSSQEGRSAPTGLGQMLGLGSALSGVQNEAYGVADYLSSHDAVAALQKRLNLEAIFRRPGTDPISALGRNETTSEELLKYYRKQVSVHYEPTTGITELRVRAFRPEDAHAVASTLMQLGEQRVNDMNRRAYDASVASALRQFTDAQKEVTTTQIKLTSFRQSQGDIDPQESGAAQTKLVTELDGQVAAARAALATMRGTISSSSPQVVSQQQRLASLEAQLAAYRGRLSGNAGATAIRLGEFEKLRIQQKFAAERYQAAAALYEKAREDASRQQLFVARVVEANMPQQALYPKRLQIVATVALALLLVYAIGWLVVAGVREHSA